MPADNSATPRRALGPLPDDGAPLSGRFASDDAFDEDPSETTVVLRRLAMTPSSPSSPADHSDSGEGSSAARAGAASPISPDDPLAVESSTPVPPPMPVLPDAEAALPPASGRRFSASAEPSEHAWAAPRRSAASPLSPPSPVSAVEAALPSAGTRPTAPPSVTVTAPTAAAADSDTTDAAKATKGRIKPTSEKTDAAKARTSRGRKQALVIIAAVTAFVALIAGVVYLLTLNSTAPSGAPTVSAASSALDPLVDATELSNLGGVDWSTATLSEEAARPLCLPAEAAGLPTAQRTVERKLAVANTVNAVVQVVDTYVDAAAATTAYGLRLAEAGTCPDAVALITGANTISGLADEAAAVRLTVQNEANEFHSLQLTRTGRTVSLIDVVTTTAEATADQVARATIPSANRQCTGSEGACPTSPVTEAVPPPAGTAPGWLVEADLPRITPGVGRWGATDPATALHLIGSQCEGVDDLNTIAGTTSVGQRTLLLADDAKAPTGFGVDQAVYTFSADTAATKLRDKLVKNLGSCADRAPTATVTEGPTIKGAGASGAKISGSTFTVVQKTEANTVVYRVAVLTVGSRTVYLLANPSTSFDFTDASWRQLSVRAGQRVSQG